MKTKNCWLFYIQGNVKASLVITNCHCIKIARANYTKFLLSCLKKNSNSMYVWKYESMRKTIHLQVDSFMYAKNCPFIFRKYESMRKTIHLQVQPLWNMLGESKLGKYLNNEIITVDNSRFEFEFTLHIQVKKIVRMWLSNIRILLKLLDENTLESMKVCGGKGPM